MAKKIINNDAVPFDTESKNGIMTMDDGWDEKVKRAVERAQKEAERIRKRNAEAAKKK